VKVPLTVSCTTEEKAESELKEQVICLLYQVVVLGLAMYVEDVAPVIFVQGPVPEVPDCH
jgi:hypothetical protein